MFTLTLLCATSNIAFSTFLAYCIRLIALRSCSSFWFCTGWIVVTLKIHITNEHSPQNRIVIGERNNISCELTIILNLQFVDKMLSKVWADVLVPQLCPLHRLHWLHKLLHVWPTTTAYHV